MLPFLGNFWSQWGFFRNLCCTIMKKPFNILCQLYSPPQANLLRMPLQFWLGWQGPGLGFSIGLAWSTWTLSLLYSLSVQREASCLRFFNFLGLLVSEKLWVATIWQIDFISADHTFRDNKRPRMFGWTSNPYKLVLFHEKQGDDHFFYMCSLAQKELVKNIQVNF